jgi:hypothetical protein
VEDIMSNYKVSLIGLFDTVVFRMEVKAKDRGHAIRIAAATYDDCYKRGDAEEI